MDTPVLIIGSGLAGLMTAYRLAEQGVACRVVTKGADALDGTNSAYAQGGIIYRSEEDSAESLREDILAAGDRINSPQAVRQLAEDGVQLVKELLIDQIAVPFDRERDHLSFTQEAAHQHARIIHVKDHTGKSIMESLWKAVQAHEKIEVMTECVLVDVLTSGHNCKGYEMKYDPNWCLGAYVYDLKEQQVKKVLAPYTVLCTGGVGQLYRHHTNAEHAYGSGLAVANRAGVRIINARFVQFHPTALWTPEHGRRFLISEALRGEGARLHTRDGRFIMEDYPQKDLSSRAVISRVMMEELQRSGDEFLLLNIAESYTGKIPLRERFPSIYETCLEQGIDLEKESIPVVPAEHFFCGGIAVGLDGNTELPGLFAVGEVACTGVHGANRLASTSLLECLTWAVKAADRISGLLDTVPNPRLQRAFELVEDWDSFGNTEVDPIHIEQKKETIRNLMWNQVGIIRTKEGLFDARDQLRVLWKQIDQQYATSALTEPLIELRHMVEAAYIIAVSASRYTNLKKDSLGGHILSDKSS